MSSIPIGQHEDKFGVANDKGKYYEYSTGNWSMVMMLHELAFGKLSSTNSKTIQSESSYFGGELFGGMWALTVKP
jgi:hypothetical protein